MGEKIVVVTGDTFEEKVLKNSLPVLVDFWAEWCEPCRVIGPILEELAEQYDGKVAIAKLNVDENREFTVQQGIQVIPTLLFFKEGQEVERVTGVQPKTALQAKVDSLL